MKLNAYIRPRIVVRRLLKFTTTSSSSFLILSSATCLHTFYEHTISIPFRIYYSTDSCGVLLTILLSRSVCLHSLFVLFFSLFFFGPFSLLFV